MQGEKDQSDVKFENLKLEAKDKQALESKIRAIYFAEYEECFPKILQMNENEFIANLKTKIDLILTDMYSDKYSTLIRVTRILKDLHKEIHDEYYKKEHKIIESFWKKNKNKEAEKPNFLLHPHCLKSGEEPIHHCGTFFTPIYDESDYERIVYVSCGTCEEVYYSDSILMYCEHCQKEYFTDITDSERKQFQPATWEKYHCGALVNDQMHCIKCSDLFYIRSKDGYLYCKNCKYEADPHSIAWNCFICQKDFSCGVKPYLPLEFKLVKSIVKNTLLFKVPAKPDRFPCCNVDLSNTVLTHKADCKGSLYEGTMDRKKIVICDRCKYITGFDNVLWTCPDCSRRFKLRNNKDSREVKESSKEIKDKDDFTYNSPLKPNKSEKNQKKISSEFKLEKDVKDDSEEEELENANAGKELQSTNRDRNESENLPSTIIIEEKNDSPPLKNKFSIALNEKLKNLNSNEDKSYLSPKGDSRRLKELMELTNKIDIPKNLISSPRVSENKTETEIEDAPTKKNPITNPNAGARRISLQASKSAYTSPKVDKSKEKETDDEYNCDNVAKSPKIEARNFKEGKKVEKIPLSKIKNVKFKENNTESFDSEMRSGEISQTSTNKNISSSIDVKVALKSDQSVDKIQSKNESQVDEENSTSRERDRPIVNTPKKIIDKEQIVGTPSNQDNKSKDSNYNTPKKDTSNKSKSETLLEKAMTPRFKKEEENLIDVKNSPVCDKEAGVISKPKSHLKKNNSYVFSKQDNIGLQENHNENNTQVTISQDNTDVKSKTDDVKVRPLLKKASYIAFSPNPKKVRSKFDEAFELKTEGDILENSDEDRTTDREKSDKPIMTGSITSKNKTAKKTLFSNSKNSDDEKLNEKTNDSATSSSKKGNGKKVNSEISSINSSKMKTITKTSDIIPSPKIVSTPESASPTKEEDHKEHESSMKNTSTNSRSNSKNQDKERSIDSKKATESSKFSKTNAEAISLAFQGLHKEDILNREDPKSIGKPSKEESKSGTSNLSKKSNEKLDTGKAVKDKSQLMSTIESLSNLKEAMLDRQPISMAGFKDRNISNIQSHAHSQEVESNPAHIIKDKIISKNDSGKEREKISAEESFSKLKAEVSEEKVSKLSEDDPKLKEFVVEDYNILSQIGEGAFGKIYLVEHKTTKARYSLKKVIAESEEELEAFTKEFELVNSIRHPGILQILGACNRKLDFTTLVLYILMEVAKCDWEKEIKNNIMNKKSFSSDHIIRILDQTISGLSFLQQKNISHRDIKPQNILVFDNLTYKVADFGEAKELKRNKQMNTLRGTEAYMSPILYEALKYNIFDVTHNAYKSDVYSLGLCMIYAISNNLRTILDFRNARDEKQTLFLIKRIVNNTYNSKLIVLLSKMLEIKEEKRPDFIQLEAYFKGLFS